jgi:hypothetical protein
VEEKERTDSAGDGTVGRLYIGDADALALRGKRYDARRAQRIDIQGGRNKAER